MEAYIQIQALLPIVKSHDARVQRNFRGFPHHALESDFSRNWVCNGVLEVEIRAPDLPIELNVRENDRESLRRTAKVLG